MKAKQFISPLDLPKENKVKEFEKLFEHPIVSVSLETGIDTGIGLEEAWNRQNQRARTIWPTPAEIIKPSRPKVRVKVSCRKWGHVDVEEVKAAWEASGHNKAEGARIMRVHESTFSNWVKRFIPEAVGNARHHLPKEDGDGHNLG